MTNTTSIRAPEIRRKALETALRESLGTFRHEEIEVEHMADPLDEVRWAMERELASKRLDQRAHLAREIRDALDRMEDGSFGTCERCEQAIGNKRLEALPWARLCVACQNEAERSNGAAPALGRAA